MRIIRIGLALLCFACLVACNINTMFNARNYFKSAQERPLNTNGKPNNQAIEDYTKTIKKCGIIITERKKGAQMDDAVFLMAKALYFKGNSAFQAKDQFENLILGFPKSPYVAESHIFVAKILREINQPKDAERRLDEFVRNPRFRKDHPKALLLLTDFAIQDKDYPRAQYWLGRIIRDYPKTKEYRVAYFLFGKNYYEQKDYTASLEAFEKMQGTRGIDKALKLDTKYYIGLNELELGKLDQAYRTASSLLRAETRPDKIPAIRMLKARILFARGENSEAVKEIEDINKTYPRTESSAAALYYLAEYQYYKGGDPTTAITNYNRVRSEFPTSAFGTIAQNKATAVTNVQPRANLNSETGLKAFLDYYYQASESFLSHLALPDSAIAVYRRVISERDVLAANRDSLQVVTEGITAVLDSLRIASLVVMPETTQSDTIVGYEAITLDSLATEIDSLDVAPVEPKEELELPAQEELVLPEVVVLDSLATVSDSLFVPPAEPKEELVLPEQTEFVLPDQPDSLNVLVSMPAEPDTLFTVTDSLQFAIADSTSTTVSPVLEAENVTEEPEDTTPAIDPVIAGQIAQQEAQLKRIESQIDRLDEIIRQFDTEIVPFCLFAIGNVLHDTYPESPENAQTYTFMQANYANNKYTNALKSVQMGQTVRLIDPFEESQEAKLDSLLGMIETQPDSALAGLEEMRESPFARLKLAANFRLGWYYCFDAPDTSLAKPYLMSVLEDTNAGEYATLTRRFFDGRKYLLWEKEVLDSLVIADSLFVSDSLGIAAPIPMEPDTLMIQSPEIEVERSPIPEPDMDNPEPLVPDAPPIIKEEDTPLE